MSTTCDRVAVSLRFPRVVVQAPLFQQAHEHRGVGAFLGARRHFALVPGHVAAPQLVQPFGPALVWQ